MSIHPVESVGAAHATAFTAPAKKPESKELPGVVDHDGDAEDKGAAAKASASGARPGRVDLKA